MPKRVNPDRCRRCGRLMVMVRLPGLRPGDEAQRLVGWRCLVCGKVVDLHGVGHRHEGLEREDARSRSWESTRVRRIVMPRP